jgi:hypothetical protein
MENGVGFFFYCSPINFYIYIMKFDTFFVGFSFDPNATRGGKSDRRVSITT